jgi:hypothetical protein
MRTAYHILVGKPKRKETTLKKVDIAERILEWILRK